jgi:hypothetical protein
MDRQVFFNFLLQECKYMLKSVKQKERRNTISGVRIVRWLLLTNVLAFSSVAAAADAPPDIRKLITPAAVSDVVSISPFTLEEGYRYNWRQERPFIKSGLLVVFKVNPDYVYPRNAAEPVLYAGNQTVQRLNQGNESGYVVAIIPGAVDLAREPVWFGTPELPEVVNAQTIEMERAKAEKAGIKPFDAEQIENVTGDRISASDLAALLREQVAELLVKFSPQEKALAETWRLPVAKQ